MQDSQKHYESPTQISSQQDDIDLRKLFQAIGNFFSSIWDTFIGFLALFRRKTIDNRILLIVLGVVGVGAGSYSYFSSPEYFRSSILVRSSVLKGALMVNVIDRLNTLTSDPERVALAELFSLDSETAKLIKGFEAIPFESDEDAIDLEVFEEQLKGLRVPAEQIELIAEKLASDNRTTYEILVRVNDASIMKDLEDPLLAYLREIPYLKRRLQVEKLNREQKIIKIQKELRKLDSLKQVIYRNLEVASERTREGSNNVILADSRTNPVAVFQQDMLLFEQEQEVRKSQLLEPEFEIVDGFTTFSTPESPGLVKSVLFGALIFIGLGYLLIIARDLNSYLAKVEDAN